MKTHIKGAFFSRNPTPPLQDTARFGTLGFRGVPISQFWKGDPKTLAAILGVMAGPQMVGAAAPFGAPAGAGAKAAIDRGIKLYRDVTPAHVRGYLHQFYGRGRPLTYLPQRYIPILQRDVEEKIALQEAVPWTPTTMRRGPNNPTDPGTLSQLYDGVIGQASNLPAQRLTRAGILKPSEEATYYGDYMAPLYLLRPDLWKQASTELRRQRQRETELVNFLGKYGFRVKGPLGGPQVLDWYEFFPEAYDAKNVKEMLHTSKEVLLDILRLKLGGAGRHPKWMWSANSPSTKELLNTFAFTFPRALAARYGTPYPVIIDLPPKKQP